MSQCHKVATKVSQWCNEGVYNKVPVSRQRLKLSSEWKLSEATCGRPQRSAPSSTCSSYLIQRAVSFHSRSSPSPHSSSSCTNTSCGVWSNTRLVAFLSPGSTIGAPWCRILKRRIPFTSSKRWPADRPEDTVSSMLESPRLFLTLGVSN